MRHLLPFSLLSHYVIKAERDGVPYVELRESDFLNIIRMFLENAPLDDAWYCQVHPEIAHSIATGNATSARAHYIWHGYFEGRVPYDFYFPEGDLATFYHVPETLFEDLRTATIALRSRSYAAALVGFRRALSLYPSSRVARLELGLLLLRQRHFMEAE